MVNWGPTNDTCAVWSSGVYLGTRRFPGGAHPAFKDFLAADRSVWMTEKGDDIDHQKFLPWCDATGRAEKAPEDLQYSTSLADHWWLGAEPAFALELLLSEGRDPEASPA